MSGPVREVPLRAAPGATVPVGSDLSVSRLKARCPVCGRFVVDGEGHLSCDAHWISENLTGEDRE